MGKICVKCLLSVLLATAFGVGALGGSAVAAGAMAQGMAYVAVLDCPSGVQRAVVGADGKFAFKDVAPGACKLSVEPAMPGVAAGSVKTPRDSASGMATGKRQHAPMPILRVDIDGDASATMQQDEGAWAVSPAALTVKGKSKELTGHVTLIK